jgi:hypothetical protein
MDPTGRLVLPGELALSNQGGRRPGLPRRMRELRSQLHVPGPAPSLARDSAASAVRRPSRRRHGVAGAHALFRRARVGPLSLGRYDRLRPQYEPLCQEKLSS